MAKDKLTNEEALPETLAEAEPAIDPLVEVITTDEFAGQGGSYTYDPATNTRTLNKEP